MAKTAGTSTNASAPETASTVKPSEPKADGGQQQAERAGGGTGTVKYIGDAGVREISKADWASVGIEHDAVRWDEFNEYTLPLDTFSAEALEILRRDRGLKITE